MAPTPEKCLIKTAKGRKRRRTRLVNVHHIALQFFKTTSVQMSYKYRYGTTDTSEAIKMQLRNSSTSTNTIRLNNKRQNKAVTAHFFWVWYQFYPADGSNNQSQHKGSRMHVDRLHLPHKNKASTVENGRMTGSDTGTHSAAKLKTPTHIMCAFRQSTQREARDEHVSNEIHTKRPLWATFIDVHRYPPLRQRNV